MSVDVQAFARVRVRAPVLVSEDSLTEPPRKLESFGRRRNEKFHDSMLVVKPKYHMNDPTRNLQSAGEAFARLTSFSDVVAFHKFLDQWFHFRKPNEGQAPGDSFFNAVNTCMQGSVVADSSKLLRAMAFEDTGFLNGLRNKQDHLEARPGVPVKSSITPSALAKNLGICITVLRSIPVTRDASQQSFTRTTHSGESDQCTATHEILLFRDENGYQSLIPRKITASSRYTWNDFWMKMFS